MFARSSTNSLHLPNSNWVSWSPFHWWLVWPVLGRSPGLEETASPQRGRVSALSVTSWMGVAARSLLVQFLLPLAAAGATVSLRLPVAAKGLLLGASLSALMGVLLIAGLCGYRGRL